MNDGDFPIQTDNDEVSDHEIRSPIRMVASPRFSSYQGSLSELSLPPFMKNHYEGEELEDYSSRGS